MSMTQMGRCALVLLMVPGLAGCGGSKVFVPSAPSSVPAPRPPATGFAANSIFPQSGATWHETAVEILGAGFEPGVAVTFGTVAAGNAVVVDSTTIWAEAPGSPAGTVDVVVTNRGGESSTLARAFTFVSAGLP